jgi:hypothetical protein
LLSRRPRNTLNGDPNFGRGGVMAMAASNFSAAVLSWKATAAVRSTLKSRGYQRNSIANHTHH